MTPQASADAALRWLQYKGTQHDTSGSLTACWRKMIMLILSSMMRGSVMGWGSIRWGRVLCLAAVAAGLLHAPTSARERNTGMWNVLRGGGFTGAMNEDAHVQPLGDMDIGGRHYRLMLFDWFESPRNMQGSYPHGKTRLLVFEILKSKPVYLGSYMYGGDFISPSAKPRIEGHMVVFPFKKEEGYEPTDRLVFDEKGPPSRVVLDGEICDFFK